MLLTFRLANFRSIRDEAELSMMLPSRTSFSDRVVGSLPNGSDHVGTVAAIFGPNASGKSNVLAGGRTMALAVEFSHQRWNPEGGAPHDPFLLDDEHVDAPTLFEVELLLDSQRWQYGFRLDKNGIVAEWLYSFPHARRRVWFERERPDHYYFGKSLIGPLNTLRDLTRPNSLFLSVGAANNHPTLSRIAHWFSRHARFAGSFDQQTRFAYTAERLADPNMSDEIQRLLCMADLGIARAEQKREKIDEDTLSRLVRALEILEADEDVPSRLADLIATRVDFFHHAGDKTVRFRFDQESQGTQAWFALLGPVAMALSHGDTLFVDELDSSLHPQLVAELIELFRSSTTNSRAAQLIFTTHSTALIGSLVSDKPLHRDELWLTEKDNTGRTRLYPLTDFRPRKHENLERGYLRGRYGGIPIVGGLAERSRSATG